MLTRGGKEARRTVYAGAYEKVTEDGRTREYYYLDGNTLAIRENGTVRYYAAFTDQQGSVLSVVDEDGVKVFEATYDAWGRQTVTLNTIGLSRGYTGHEMMPEFGLINMNGRLYDPTLGRFLSPDNYVQEPGNSQSFNRYSYCLNNPLKYTDPSGELFGIDDVMLASAIFGAAMNMTHSMLNAAYSGQSIWKAGAMSLLSSAASCAVSFGVGAAFGGAGGMGHELLRAGAHGLADAMLSSLEGGKFGSTFLSSALSSGLGSFAQSLHLGTNLMVASSAVTGGVAAWAAGGDFLQGALNGLQIGLLNHAMHDGGFGINYYHDKNGNQCGDISEVVVTPSSLSEASSAAEFSLTTLNCVGSSLKDHGGNSTWGSNFKFYWHAKGEQGFYGNQYVSTVRLANVGKFITKYTSNINKLSNAYKVSRGVITDFQNYSQYGYTDAHNTIQAISDGICSWGGSAAGAQVGGLIFAPLGPLGVCVGVAAFGIVGDYIGNNYFSPFVMDKIYGK